MSTKYEDWWWKVALGKCYYRLGMLRDAEKQFKSAVQQQPMVATFLMLAKVCPSLHPNVVFTHCRLYSLSSFLTVVFTRCRLNSLSSLLIVVFTHCCLYSLPS